MDKQLAIIMVEGDKVISQLIEGSDQQESSKMEFTLEYLITPRRQDKAPVLLTLCLIPNTWEAQNWAGSIICLTPAHGRAPNG